MARKQARLCGLPIAADSSAAGVCLLVPVHVMITVPVSVPTTVFDVWLTGLTLRVLHAHYAATE